MFIWMQLNGVNCSRLHNDVSDRFMSFERATAINILALMITLFGVRAQVTA
ncbi:UNVERIFIED_ORG: hypothetical protein J2W64_003619 [Rahnella aquatilis]|nr:hypothetical protein [Rahnella aquatilis]